MENIFAFKRLIAVDISKQSRPHPFHSNVAAPPQIRGQRNEIVSPSATFFWFISSDPDCNARLQEGSAGIDSVEIRLICAKADVLSKPKRPEVLSRISLFCKRQFVASSEPSFSRVIGVRDEQQRLQPFRPAEPRC
jgi:hypothetical protein